MIRAFFVYGTLKTGQCRSRLWPCQPLGVDQAWTQGALFGRHDYPAMRRGDDRVAGELWRFDADQVPQVLATLDQIEGTNQPDQPDLYVRVVVQTWQGDAPPDAPAPAQMPAYTYLYACDPILHGFEPILPGSDGFVRWP